MHCEEEDNRGFGLMKTVLTSFFLFSVALSFGTSISDLSTATATICIDGFDVEMVYFIPFYNAQHRENEKVLQKYANYFIKDYLLKPGDENLLGYIVFETIDTDFFKIGHGPFAVSIPEEHVRGEFKPSYSKYSSLKDQKLKFYQTREWNSLVHYLGGGLVSYPIYNDAIDRSKPFELSMEFCVMPGNSNIVKLDLIVDGQTLE